MAQDPLDGEPMPGVFLTLDARKQAQGYTGSYLTGINYAGSVTAPRSTRTDRPHS